ncbi:MAG: hypothetical protein ABR926_13845 [Streptosporangiaceae bacterium]
MTNTFRLRFAARRLAGLRLAGLRLAGLREQNESLQKIPQGSRVERFRLPGADWVGVLPG